MIDIELQRTRSAMAESVTLPIATWLEVLDELEALRQVEPVKQEPVLFDKWDVDEAKSLLPAMRQGVALLEYVAGVLPKSTEPVKQEPVARLSIQALLKMYDEEGGDWCKIARAVERHYTAPVRTKDLTEKWIDPNDKSQKQYLPHIGEKVLFCCDGEVYYGHHTGGAFQKGHGVTKSLFTTWDCMWMHLPTAFIAPNREKNK